MFGVQTYFLSKAFGYLIRILIFSIDSSLLNNDIFLVFLLGIDIIDWISFIIVIIFHIKYQILTRMNNHYIPALYLFHIHLLL